MFHLVHKPLTTPSFLLVDVRCFLVFFLFFLFLATLVSPSSPSLPSFCLSLIPTLCPMLLGNELMLFQFDMFGSSRRLSRRPFSYSLSCSSLDAFSQTLYMLARFSWPFLKGFYRRGMEMRSDMLADFHSPLICE